MPPRSPAPTTSAGTATAISPGSQGEEIPLSGRITALADVWDTLTHERPYKPAWSEERALAEIASGSGAHFDPRVVEAFGRIDRQAINELSAINGVERAA